ncbi:MAG: hypothetical protein P4L43_16225 [Syntrophobacteraceae bacterium]|nr:hypothetical protein [Syntrophobacteraceae bacterium]
MVRRPFRGAGGLRETRILAHAFFVSLNGIPITFKNFPGRSEEEALRHMKMVGRVVARLFEHGMGLGELRDRRETMR